MSREPPGPDETGEPTPQWIGFALDVGLMLASTFGLGLSLFNALRVRFGDVSADILGDIASTIGTAVRAATGLSGDELQLPPVLDDLPLVPASWHEGAAEDRVLVGVNVPFVPVGSDTTKDMRMWVNQLEDQALQQAIDQAINRAIEAARHYPEKIAQIEQDLDAQLVFLARRF